MAAQASLIDLASNISKDAATVSNFLKQAGHDQPSFSANGPARFPADAPEEILSARANLIHSARQLQFLALGPTEALQWYALTGMRIIIPGLGGENLVPATRSAKNLISCQALDTATLRWLYHYDIPAAVPAQGTISFADLAQKLSLSQRVLTRIVRHAILNNIFAEPTPGNVAHTSLSLQLARPGNSVRGVVGHQTETVFPAVAHMVEAHERNGTQDESVMHTPFHEAFGTPMKPLDWVAADPVRSARFAESMKGGASSGPFNTGHTVRAFDWDSLGDATVVDVGGSAGQLSKAIAAAAPRLRFIVQDRPSMILKGESELEPEFKDRVTFQSHDFFDPNTVSEPAVFLLRLILHDWPDGDAAIILKNLVCRMGPETRLLINDAIMPEPGTVHPLQEKYIRNVDMMMLSMFNGLERTQQDWEDLISKTDSSLKIAKIVKPKGSALSLLEIVKV